MLLPWSPQQKPYYLASMMSGSAGGSPNTSLLTAAAFVTTTATILFTYYYRESSSIPKIMRLFTTAKEDTQQHLPSVLTQLPKIRELIHARIDDISNDALVKIVRQLMFWSSESSLSEEEMLDLTRRLLDTATIGTRNTDNEGDNTTYKVPKLRYGKTELQMPVLTCGGMRLQHTWMPDSIPVLSPSSKTVLKSESQQNLVNLLRLCFKFGVTHFETARFYGTSEMQFSDALFSMMQSGEIKREDFILQTKIPPADSGAQFETSFELSWAHLGERFGYIDLFAFHCVSKETQVEWLLSDADDGCMAKALQYQKEGKIRHIGFSTHGTAKNILQLINSEKFSFVNLHYHYFGSYHAEGTPDGVGGHGNAHAVRRATELDMGVFNISPLDKGGMMYKPSKLLARLIGPNLQPISFANWTSWENNFHTVTIGVARPSDLEESVQSARLYFATESAKTSKAELMNAKHRLEAKKQEVLGKDWSSKGLLSIPDCEDILTQHVAIGHILWCYNTLKAFGMYDFSSERYAKLIEVSSNWKKNKTFDENMAKVQAGNMGRAFEGSVDYSAALSKHYDQKEAISKMSEVHAIMIDQNQEKPDEWEPAYDLRPWVDYPGDMKTMTVGGVVLQNLSGGWLGMGGGPNKASKVLAETMRSLMSS